VKAITADDKTGKMQVHQVKRREPHSQRNKTLELEGTSGSHDTGQ